MLCTNIDLSVEGVFFGAVATAQIALDFGLQLKINETYEKILLKHHYHLKMSSGCSPPGTSIIQFDILMKPNEMIMNTEREEAYLNFFLNPLSASVLI